MDLVLKFKPLCICYEIIPVHKDPVKFLAYIFKALLEIVVKIKDQLVQNFPEDILNDILIEE